MPTYVYEYCCKVDDNDDLLGDTFEYNISIENRDTLKCSVCDSKIKRRVAFNGLTWSPTKNGGHS